MHIICILYRYRRPSSGRLNIKSGNSLKFGEIEYEARDCKTREKSEEIKRETKEEKKKKAKKRGEVFGKSQTMYTRASCFRPLGWGIYRLCYSWLLISHISRNTDGRGIHPGSTPPSSPSRNFFSSARGFIFFPGSSLPPRDRVGAHAGITEE